MLLLLGIVALAQALPQGTFFWNFESPGPNNNYWPAGWTYSPTGLTIGEYGAALNYSPTRSLEFRGNNGEFYIISQPLYFVAGEQLTFSCWVKNAGNGTVDTRMEWATSTAGPWTIFQDPNNFNGVAPWTQNVGTFAPTTTGTYYIRYWLKINGVGLGYVDDFTLTYNEGAVLNVNSTGYMQPGTQIYRNNIDTGFTTYHSFPATPENVASLAGTYTPGTPPAGYHWVNPTITVATTDFTLANGYVHTITFILEKDFTLNVQALNELTNQPFSTQIYQNTLDTGQTTPHTFTATTASALAGNYTPGPAPDGYYWEATSIDVLASGFTEANDRTQSITFVLKKYYELRVYSSGNGQPGTDIFKDSTDSGFNTDHIFYATSAAALAGSYAPVDALTGYHWVTTPIIVSEGDFTLANSYIHSITFVLQSDDPLPVELSSFNAAISVQNMVDLIWVTQTETNVSGFRIYRNAAPNLENAVMLNTFVGGTNTSQTQVYFYRDEEISSAGTYYYWLQSLDFDGANQFYGPVSVTVQQYQATPPPIEAVQGIDKVFPNPFNPSVSIQYTVTQASMVSLDVYDLRGRHVTTLFSGNREPGLHKLVWQGTDRNGNNLGSGIYTIRMSAGGKQYSRKVMLLK